GSKSMIWMLGGLAAAAGLAGVVVWLGPNLLRLSSGPGGVVARNGASNGTSSAPGASTAPTSLIPPLASASRIALQDNDGVIGLDATGALHMLKSGATAPNASTAPATGSAVPAMASATPAISDALKQDAIAALDAGTLPQTAAPRELRRGGPLTLMSESQTRAK